MTHVLVLKLPLTSLAEASHMPTPKKVQSMICPWGDSIMTPTGKSLWSPEALPKDVLVWQQEEDNRDFSKEFPKQRSEGKVFYQ